MLRLEQGAGQRKLRGRQNTDSFQPDQGGSGFKGHENTVAVRLGWLIGRWGIRGLWNRFQS
jgi:hypothetical protein